MPDKMIVIVYHLLTVLSEIIIFSLSYTQLFRLSGRLREIHTRKRDSQVVEYGLFAICSPANSSHSHHSGATVKKEVALTAQKRLERANSEPICSRFVSLFVLYLHRA